MKRIGLLLVLASSPVLACAADIPKLRLETLLTNVAAEPESALDVYFAGSSLPKLKPEAFTALKVQIKSALSVYGKPLGFERVAERDFTPSMKRLTYIQKFDPYVVVWEAYFYKPRDEWVPYTINFNDQVQIMLNGR